MKRLSILFVICFAAMALFGCGTDYTQRARLWICDNTDHFVSITKEPALYYFEDYTLFGDPYLTKVNLEDMTTSRVKSITCKEGNSTYNFNHLIDYAIPADKGYNDSESFIVVAEDRDLPNDKQQVGIIFNPKSGVHHKICQGTYVKTHGYALVSNTMVTAGSISSVDIYDVAGNKLTTKAYEGTIAGQKVVAEIVEKDGAIAGSYYYSKYGPGKHRIWIYGSIDEERNSEIEGRNADYYNCEDWDVVIKDGLIEGRVYINFNRRSYNFVLTEIK